MEVKKDLVVEEIMFGGEISGKLLESVRVFKKNRENNEHVWTEERKKQ